MLRHHFSSLNCVGETKNDFFLLWPDTSYFSSTQQKENSNVAFSVSSSTTANSLSAKPKPKVNFYYATVPEGACKINTTVIVTYLLGKGYVLVLALNGLGLFL